MLTKRLTMRVLAGVTLWAGFSGAAQAQLPAVTPEGAFKQWPPRQPGVNVSTPNPAQIAQCTVTPIPNPQDPKNSPMGFIVRDPAGKPVRQFVSYDGKGYNIIAFYLDGVEAYREVYPAAGEFQFRWLGPNGSKWGIDKDRDGKIDEWGVISPEELSQELLQAVLTKDAKRIEALTLTKANLDGINFKGAEAQKLLDRAAGSVKKLGEAVEGLKAGPEAKWDHLQLGIPQTTPYDAIGAKDDIVVHKNGTIMVLDGTNTKFLQTGEIVLINRAWKLVDGPSAGAGGSGNGGQQFPEAIRALLAEFDRLDAEQGKIPPTQANLAAYNAKRAQVLEQIVAKLEPKDQEAWAQMLVDSLLGAVDGEKPDGKHITRLKQLKDTLAKGPNPALAAYAAFRYLIAENSVALANPSPEGGLQKVQAEWRTSLEEFIKNFPNADDTAEAMLRLAMAFEFQGNDGEAKAKEWYTRLAQTKHPHSAKAAGAIRRLDSEGKPIELVGPNLANGTPVNVAGLQGKAVVVYYWASWSSTLAGDAQRLKSLVKDYGAKGLEVVTVCLDSDAKIAGQTAAAHGLPGTHLFAAGGLDASPLAAHYGILVVPHVFVVGKDGKVANRNAQIASLEDDVKKLLP